MSSGPPLKGMLKGKKGRSVGGVSYTYIFTPGSLFEIVSKVGFLKQALEANEPMNLDAPHIIVMAPPGSIQSQVHQGM